MTVCAVVGVGIEKTEVVELAVVCLPITLSATATVTHNNPKPKNAFIFVVC